MAAWDLVLWACHLPAERVSVVDSPGLFRAAVLAHISLCTEKHPEQGLHQPAKGCALDMPRGSAAQPGPPITDAGKRDGLQMLVAYRTKAISSFPEW